MTPYQNFVIPLMILHILLKTTLLILFVTSSQAQIGAFKCTSQLNESPSRSVKKTKKNKQKNKKNLKSFNRKPSGFDRRLNGIGDIYDVTALVSKLKLKFETILFFFLYDHLPWTNLC